ncbi:SCO7613 C-terminal domain-containing membrane protein [Halobacillus sp. K22]|uniref:SCO7613 C-terminal domain-containing membrane protein n=1 Tax=Halobacillus sp. K22 TaxID=3457431 RepID=UPI003FCC6324
MAHLPENEKRKVFKDQLEHLRNNGYLTDEAYLKVLEADRTYIQDKKREEEHKELHTAAEPAEARDSVPEQKPVKPKKVKKTKSKEEIRERNITWSLILGVSLLLITGLIVATSQWEQMGPGMKVFSIFFVSLFFHGLSYATGKFLKIEKTAFAFLTLGSLLIPIAIVAIGFFGLFGDYLSLYGEGRYLLGLLGTLLPLPLYIRHAVVHKSRLYVWISFVFLSLSIGFSLGALPLSMDAFYMCLMLFNAILLGGYVWFKNSDRWSLFIKELPLYAQLNLVLSTLLMLFFFESEVFYSFNLLLTASIYMAMVFIYQTKEYQFVFSVMVVYAIYQLVENSPLQSVDITVYAVVGLVYLGFAYAFRNHHFVEKVFRYTSGIVSFCAFVYISYESILLRGEEGSWLLLIAYAIITVNYLLLSNLNSYVVFHYMTPVFFFITLWQLWEITQVGPLFLFLFIGAVVSLLYIGLWTNLRWLQVIAPSTVYTSISVMAGCIGYSLYDERLAYSSFMFLAISVLAYPLKRKYSHMDMGETAIWVHPVALFISAAILYEPLIGWFPAYKEGLAFPFHLALTGILLTIVHLVWNKFRDKQLSAASFYTGQGSYILAMIILAGNPWVDPVLIRPFILFIGIGMMMWLVLYAQRAFLWLFVSVTMLAFYISLLDPLSFDSFASFFTYMIVAPVLLVFLGDVRLGKWGERQPYFYWLAHAVQPLLIGLFLINSLGGEAMYPWVLVIPLSLYVYSSLTAAREWAIKLMLYAALTTLFFAVWTVPGYFGWWEAVPETYAWLVTSIGIAGIWMGVPDTWKKRIEWYLIPFSIFGLSLFINRLEPWAPYEWLFAVGYVILILFFMHRRKWSLARFVPLLFSLALWHEVTVDWERLTLVILMVVCIGILLAAGRYFHSVMIGPKLEADAYSWTALLYIGYLNLATMVDENVWIRVVPVVLLSIWFLFNAKKWEEPLLSKSFITLGAACLYAGYIIVLLDYHALIPDLIEAELQALPILLVLFFLRRNTWREYAGVLNHIQLGILLLIAAYLVVDGIQSHTIWDAWILGGLSLISMIAGMQWRVKSYFFVGMGVLIFNVLYQTRPYWGNLPWWVYLLLAGLILIGIASYNEWQKQQSDDHKPVDRKIKRIWTALKKWN